MMRCGVVSLVGAVGLSCGVSSAQPIEWLNPVSGSWPDPGNWTGGVVPSLPTDEPVLGLAGAYTVTSSATTTHGTLTISNPDVMLELSTATNSVFGDLRNNGRVWLIGSTIGFLDADRRIEGPGTLTLGAVNDTLDCQLVADSVLVTQAAGHTINGSGRLTNESDLADAIGAFRNRGLIVADDPTGPGLELHSVTLEQIGAGRIGADGGTLFLTSNTDILVFETSITGGELFIANGGSVRLGNTRSVLLSDMTISGPLVIDEADRELRLSGSINLQGQISLNPSGTAGSTELSHSLATTIAGNGEIVLRTSGANTTVFDSNALCTIGPGIVVRGSGDVFASSAGIVNNGAIIADDPAESLLLTGDFTGSGLFGADGGTLVLGNLADMTDCTLVTQGGGVVVVPDDAFVDLIGGRNLGTMELEPESRPLIYGEFVNDGTITQPVVTFNTEPVLLREGATLGGSGTISFFDSFQRAGLLGGSGMTATVGPGQTVFGEYGLDGDLLIEGVLEPETRVEIQGDVQLAPSAVVRMELGASSSETDEIDAILGGGNLTLGGTLVVELNPGFEPSDGQQWVIIRGGPGFELFGAFDTIVVPDGPPGFTYEVEEVATGIRVIAVENSCPADFNGDGSVNTLDVLAFLNAWSAGDPSADFNGDGSVNTLDVLSFLNAWTAGC